MVACPSPQRREGRKEGKGMRKKRCDTLNKKKRKMHRKEK
jgi:hypothetical protein